MWIYLCSTDLTSSAALEESASHSKTGYAPSPTAKSIPIVKQSSYLEWLQVTWCMPQFGMILKLCDLENAKSISTSYMEDSHARGLVLQDLEKAWQMSEADYFSRSSAWPKKLNLNSYSWKTQKESCQTEDLSLLKRLPPSGTHVDGLLRAVKRSDHPKIGKDGFVLPTPKASDAKRNDSPCERKRHSPDLTAFLNMYHGTKGKKVHHHFIEKMMTYPKGWTELEPWAMRFVWSKRKRRLKS